MIRKTWTDLREELKAHDHKHGRYGYLMVTTCDGGWWWDPILEMVSFVPKGKRTCTTEIGFHRQVDNTHAGAMRLICRTIISSMESNIQ